MKNLQHLNKRQSETLDKPVDAAQSEHLSITNDEPNKSRQTSACPIDSETMPDRIRKYCLYILLFVLTSHAVFGEIKNGYEKNIGNSKESLKVLRAKLLEDGNLTAAQRRRLQSTIATLVNHVSYYELTESLLTQFKTIAPQLYAEIDTITDRLGRPVDVYIRFVPINGTDVKAEGTTYMDQSLSDQDTYRSEFGEFTVSVKVWIVQKALLILAHELGHVKYQVPNLADYSMYHKSHYRYTSTPNSIGHDIDDPSGKSAVSFGKSFQKIYADFLKISDVRLQNPSVMLTRLKKDRTKET